MDGMDCSGAVQWWLESVGLDPTGDQGAEGLRQHFKKNGVTLTNAQAGALLFYGNTEAIHVDLAISNNQVIGAMSGDSTTLTLNDAIKKSACVKIRPIGYRKGLMSIIMPAYPAWVLRGE